MQKIKAIEFFSGVGAFSQAARFLSSKSSIEIDVVNAFDQNDNANQVYFLNYSLKPSVKNLVSVNASDISEANLWWMSPPCTPFTRRGRARDHNDPRASSLLRLIDLFAELKPESLILENVEGFLDSTIYGLLKARFDQFGYQYQTVKLCSTQFSVPMRRPRVFIVASRVMTPTKPDMEQFQDLRVLRQYLERSIKHKLEVPLSWLVKYQSVQNIVELDDKDAILICFTRGYSRCAKVSGSIIRLDSGEVVYVEPLDIATLMGFSSDFQFPTNLSNLVLWKLMGNTVDVRAVKYVLSMLNVC